MPIQSHLILTLIFFEFIYRLGTITDGVKAAKLSLQLVYSSSALLLFPHLCAFHMD